VRVLLIEDEDEVVAGVRAALADSDDLMVVDNRDGALSLLGDDQQFDLVVCDLRIPPSSGAGLLANEDHGLAVFAACREHLPGSPLRFFSGRANLDNLADALSEGRPVDLFGDGTSWPLIHIHQKRHAANFVEELGRLREGLLSLESEVEIQCDDELDGMTARALRIGARRVSATTAQARRAGSGTHGLSGADTLSALFIDTARVTRARNFVKVDARARIERELAGFDRYVSTLLTSGFTPRGWVLLYGLRGQAAVAYVLAEGFDTDLFGVLQGSEDLAIQTLTRLMRHLEPWMPAWRREGVAIADMRRRFIADDRLAAERSELAEFELYEQIQVDLPWVVGHGDLHGGNVLVRSDGEPILIDFGDVDLHWGAFDPVTLEVSLAFHPASPMRKSEWPSQHAAENYLDLDSYLADCPVPSFVRKVRQWAMECLGGDEQALRAVMYALATRQLKYADTDHALANSFARGSL